MDQITETGLADVVSGLVTRRGSRFAVRGLPYSSITEWLTPGTNERTNGRTGMKLLLRFASSEREFFQENCGILGNDFP